MADPLPAVYVGFGCRKGCPADDLEALLQQGLASLGLPVQALQGIASIDLKANETGLHELAASLQLPLRFFCAEQLQRFAPQLSRRSATAFAHSGCWGVAESTALALAAHTHGSARLVLTRLTLAGATLALASAG
ncbi:cobalamin biosynthesis protein [Pseudomonas shirazensis]|uniref:cobalamin biosynthesis protein n=1 Tax=Pseudomonas shirazensis TaxID=2745494 RepID=UPI003D273EB1